MTNLPAHDFTGKIHKLDFTRRRMEKLHSDKAIALRDLESVYEALFIRAVIGLEQFLESLFFAILSRRVKYVKSRVKLRMEANSSDALRDILLQGDKYIEWLPFNKTAERAKLYLVGGRPFTDLDDGAKSTIKTITTIRNAIAHRSSHAISEFHKQVIGNKPLLAIEKTPTGFLRSQVRSGPIQNRFQVYMGELVKISSELS